MVKPWNVHGTDVFGATVQSSKCVLPRQPLLLSERVAAYHLCAALQGAYSSTYFSWTDVLSESSEDIVLGEKRMISNVLISERL